MGDAGIDTAIFMDRDTTFDGGIGFYGVRVKLVDGTIETGLFFGTLSGTIGGVENVLGTAGDDNITGDDNANILFGLDGNDQLFGNGGNDILRGLNGGDDLVGGSGDDVLRGGLGDDDLISNDGDDYLGGGRGNDTFNLNGLGQVTAKGGLGQDTFTAITGDILTGGRGQDTFIFANSFFYGGTVITDFNVNKDTLDIRFIKFGTTYDLQSILDISTDVGSDVQIGFDLGNVTLEGVQKADLIADAFLFAGALA